MINKCINFHFLQLFNLMHIGWVERGVKLSQVIMVTVNGDESSILITTLTYNFKLAVNLYTFEFSLYIKMMVYLLLIK